MAKLSAEAKRALMTAKASVKKDYGDEVILDTSVDRSYKTFSTGSAIIDDAIGIKGKSGFPLGRIIEIYGPESSGKTSISMSAVAQAQKEYPDRMVLFIDAEHAFNLEYAKLFGVNTDEDSFMFVQPESAEQALNIIRKMTQTTAFSCIVLDSIASMSTDAQLGKTAEEKTMGALAGVLSPELTKIKTDLSKTDTTLILINQTRDKVSSYGGGETTPGGNAPRFYASIRIRVSKTDTITDANKEVIGQELKIVFKKNKVGTPFKEVVTRLIFGQGFDFESEFVSIAEKKGIIKRGGAWYSWTNSKGQPEKHQGLVRAANYMKANQDEFLYIKKLVQENQMQVAQNTSIEEMTDDDPDLSGDDE